MKTLKSNGVFKQSIPGLYSIRVISDGGNLSCSKIGFLNHVAECYGNGYVTICSRGCLEIPSIKEENLDTVLNLLNDKDIRTTVTGRLVHPVTSCRGTVCRNGTIDTQGLANTLQLNLLGLTLPNKVNIGVIGCSNNCLKSQNNEIYVRPYTKVSTNSSNCSSCGQCIKKCKFNALTLNNSKKITLDTTLCTQCGKCINSCLFNSICSDKVYYKVFLKNSDTRLNSYKELSINLNEDELVTKIKTILDYYIANSIHNESFASFVNRLFENINTL